MKINSQDKSKYITYIESLRRNRGFMLNMIELGEALVKRNDDKSDKLFEEIALKYSIDTDTILAMIIDDLGFEKSILDSNGIKQLVDFDICDIEDKFDLSEHDKSYLMSHPITLNIHKFATKRDVLKFIEKNWEQIESIQNLYRPSKKIIRKRKFEQAVYDYIWDNRKAPTNEIIQGLEKSFTIFEDLAISYADIYSIIREEKKRRLSELP